jgi:serine/threonine protein kinase
VDTGHGETLIGGRYAVDRRVGVGGGGAVYLAYDRLLNRWVALKKITPPDDGSSAPMATGAQEALRLASLQHPNIVTVYDFLTEGDEVHVVMEYVAGRNIDELEDPLDATLFRDFASQALEGLAAAHAQGLVHRDIKAGNIMVAGNDGGGLTVKILDFGLAKVLPEPALQTMDQSGSLFGSIYTMSPEQLSRQPIDHRTDIYSLGCVFYQALTRTHPFQGDNVPAVIAAHLQHDHHPLASLRPDLPPSLCDWVENLFAFAPDDRPPDARTAILNLRAIPTTTATKRPATGKPSLSLAPQPPPPQPATATEPTAKTPFLKDRRFTIPAAVAATALATVGILALTGNLGSKPAKKPPQEEAKAERDSFKANETSAIKKRKGETATITGVVSEVHEEDGIYFVTFDGVDTRGVTLAIPRDLPGVFKFKLEKLRGKKINVLGTVDTIGKRLVLRLGSIDDLKDISNDS